MTVPEDIVLELADKVKKTCEVRVGWDIKYAVQQAYDKGFTAGMRHENLLIRTGNKTVKWETPNAKPK